MTPELGLPMGHTAQLPKHVRVSLILAAANIDEQLLTADQRNSLARLDRRQLDVVELVVTAAIQNTCRVFLESTAAPETTEGETDV